MGVMIEIVTRRHVDAPPAQLWPLIDDVDELAGWFSFAERFELLEGSGLGRRQRLHGRWSNKRSEVDQVVTVYRPERELGWEHEQERLNGKPAPVFASTTRFSISLEPDGDGSMVTLCSQQVPASPVKGLVMKLFGTKEVAQNMETSLDRLAAKVGTKLR